MKRASLAILALLGGLIGCGGSTKTTTTAPSGVTDRAFVTNAYAGTISVVDAAKDTLSYGSVTVGTAPGMMTVSPGREVTAVFDAGTNSVTVVTNSTEAAAGAIALPGATESIVLKDAATGYAAIRSASVNGAVDPGAVVQLDTKSFTYLDCTAINRTYCTSVPFARTVVLSPDGAKLLAFSDNSDSVTIIDTAKFTSVKATVPGFNRPVSAVFSSDSSKAYVLNCGPECGGGAPASVQVLNIPADVKQASLGASVNVSAATTALLSGNTLYVAGSASAAAGAGRLNAFDISSGNPVASSTIKDVGIGDGYHTQIVSASSNKLFIGARDCTNQPGTATGCLTIFDTGTNKAVISTGREPSGGALNAVTGIAPVASRKVVYVVSGGDLRIYDTATSAETANQIDITGRAVDVKTIDQ